MPTLPHVAAKAHEHIPLFLGLDALGYRGYLRKWIIPRWGGHTRPIVCFVNVQSVDCIIYSIFQKFNFEWRTRTLSVFTQAA